MAETLKGAGTDFTVYEKAGEVGGTWRDNTFPGLFVDVASSSSQPNSRSISHVIAASLSANVRNRRRGSENHTDRERQKSTHTGPLPRLNL
jgi:cation diffusion facilitator CzcD-associated flavoprotein CzcO